MSTLASIQRPSQPAPLSASRTGFALAALAVASAAAALSGWMPLQFSIVTVFLFAGPHNWLEFRYFLTRMPARWGRLRTFFLVAFAGMIGLTAVFAAFFFLAGAGVISLETWLDLYPLWATAFVLWVALLTHMRSRQNPRREWGWVWPVAFVLIAVMWLVPPLWSSLVLVYLHPLMAFWLLDRELRRSRPEWRSTFHLCLAAVPLFLAVLWWRLADSPPLPDDVLPQQIAQHAGAGTLRVSPRLLVATHTFLEMLHYGVWVLAMPLIGLRAAPWRVEKVPLARRSPAWRAGVLMFLACSLALVVVLWVSFLADFTTTRSVYFTLAMFHVLAEVPFLLRAL
jgi:hypothetical protein